MNKYSSIDADYLIKSVVELKQHIFLCERENKEEITVYVHSL